MNALETSLYTLAHGFLLPVWLLILAALAYALLQLGGFAVELFGRFRGSHPCALAAFHQRHGGSSDDLELWIMKSLEGLRLVARTAPMLGLVATMIPMGPALLALTEGDGKGVGQNLVVAFSAVILALVAASISFWILTVRRRWLLQALRQIERQQESSH
ncbi:biopolymer transporter ExbD [Ventosimonas gracilis]|uniref:Biopolymer transporter ExbD n=1 Tax=Ventosimonas gracilis TaxID=1680762 RepID=A0A139SIS8_9GAMM|nr:MotA/TolQ/ExbB proton channel family protein [Ventosimonas gracilis]KXU34457.1 biopolymer transporter ExbD [Ventosimonas gracilis]